MAVTIGDVLRIEQDYQRPGWNHRSLVKEIGQVGHEGDTINLVGQFEGSCRAGLNRTR